MPVPESDEMDRNFSCEFVYIMKVCSIDDLELCKKSAQALKNPKSMIWTKTESVNI